MSERGRRRAFSMLTAWAVIGVTRWPFSSNLDRSYDFDKFEREMNVLFSVFSCPIWCMLAIHVVAAADRLLRIKVVFGSSDTVFTWDQNED